MDNTIDALQEDVLAVLREAFPNQKVVEAAMPDEDTLPRDERGRFDPYVAIQFGDLQQQGGKNMATSAMHNYVMPFVLVTVSPEASVSRRMMNRANVKLLGFSSDYGGQIFKRPSGMTYTIPAQQGAIEAFVSPVSFAIPVEPRDL